MSAPRLMLCGTHSGSGKTNITCGLLRALQRRHLTPTAFKVGPDYIDPMFHSAVLGAKSRNLDSFLIGEGTLRYLLDRNSAGSDIAVIEGVMGYYDGIAATPQASSFEIARLTQTPAILIVGAAGTGLSAAAVVDGFARFAQRARFAPGSGIRGVLLNRVAAALYPELKRSIEQSCGVRVYGYVPKLPGLAIESRHLGLVRPHEVDDLRGKLDLLAQKLEETVEIDALLALAAEAPELPRAARPWMAEPGVARKGAGVQNSGPVRIAVARDEAFCFYYEDNLELLCDLGAETVDFSPLVDRELPADAAGLWLGGGYPELCGDQLAANAAMREAIRSAIAGGLPTIAECGGFMYLHRSLTDLDGRRHEMCGVLDADVRYTGRLQRFGYVELETQRPTLFGGAGTRLRGHEFHYFESDRCGDAMLARKPVRGASWPCVVATGTLLAGFPHYHLYSNPACAARFVERCRTYAKRKD